MSWGYPQLQLLFNKKYYSLKSFHYWLAILLLIVNSFSEIVTNHDCGSYTRKFKQNISLT